MSRSDSRDSLPEATNPFASPNSESGALETGERRLFSELSTRELKKLANHSSSITALSWLWLVGAAFGTIYGVALVSGAIDEGDLSSALESGLAVVVLSVTALQIVTAIGTLKRSPWARFAGMALCALMLLNIPIGTLIGGFGLVALTQGGRLFGPDRLDGKALRAEFKYRKKHRVD